MIKLIYERLICNPKAKDIIKSLENTPEKWEYTHYLKDFIVHESGLEIWIGGGEIYCYITEPCEERLGIVGARKVYQAYLKAFNVPSKSENQKLIDNL